MPSVSQYWPASFWQAANQALAWLYSRQNPFAGNWLADALFTQGAQTNTQTQEPSSGLLECGVTSLTNFLTGLTSGGAQGSPIAMSQIESICSTLPPGLAPDDLLGLDGYPVNESGQALPWGNLLVNGYDVTAAMIASIPPLYWTSGSSSTTPGLPQTNGVFAKWHRNQYNQQFALIVDSNNNVQMALVNGTTENTTDNYPTWPTSPLGALTADGTQIWKLISTSYQTPGWIAAGYIFNLINASSYRVDAFIKTDQWYYQGSSALQTATLGGPNSGAQTWSLGGVNQGLLLAALYPTSVSQPSNGWSGAAIPAGWVSHTNSGVCQVPGTNQVGGKLTSYKAQVYVKTDIEYLQEDNIPIIVQSDGFHARAGSSVVPAAGTPAVHILYNDPVAGWTEVYDSLESELAYQGLPLSFIIPTNDPLYVPNPGSTDIPAIQNRSFIYDCALAIIAYSGAGNFTAAEKIIKQLNFFLDNPGYLPSTVLENWEEGGTSNWSATGSSATITNVLANSTSPPEPPYGSGSIGDFHGGTGTPAGVFAYIGSGFPDSTDTEISFEHMELAAATFVVDVAVTTAGGLVTHVQATSGAVGPATLAGSTITIPIGPGNQVWRTTLLNLESLILNLSGDSLTSVTGFKLTLTAASTDLYFDNLSLGTPQPVNSLTFSYDTYNGQIDQAYIRAGAIAWVVYAYAVYMQVSQDYSIWAELQGMITYLLTLQSTAADLTNGLFYLGYGKYQDPGYQYVAGLIQTVATEHQVDLWFAFMRSAGVLANVAINLLKTGQITQAQAASINATVAAITTAAATIWTNMLAVLYIAPSGNVPGHFAQGVTGSTLDTSQACDASGTWAALLAHANARDDIALQCLEFVYDNFLLTSQTISKSNATNSYNETYSEPTPFAGLKNYNDSAGGYSGSPASASQEQTWGMILALLRLYGITGLAAFFTGLGTTIDAVLSELIQGQATILAVTGNGSLLMYSLASRALPYEFQVWPALAPTAWLWLVATNPSLLLTVAGTPSFLPYMYIPAGASQEIDDKNGSTSVGSLEIRSIDPGGLLHTLAATQELIGQVATLSMGFPSNALGDFVPLHVVQISAIEFDQAGRVVIKAGDLKRFAQGSMLWPQGGPEEWLPGQKNTFQPSGAQWIPNAFPVSSENPRFVSGNPLDIYLAAMQNELGVGQDAALIDEVQQGSTGELIAAANPFWAKYLPGYIGTEPIPAGGNQATLINPNPYLDVPGITALRDGQFSGFWFEFKITSPQQARSWLEDQILKPLGLVQVVTSTGQITLKPMQIPVNQAPVFAFTDSNIVGIPAVSLAPIINAIAYRGDVDDTGAGDRTSARTYNTTVPLLQQASYNLFRYLYNHQVEANGVKTARGLYLLAFLLGDALFRRYGFAAPIYQVTGQLGTLQPELKDWVSLTHRLVPDYIGSGRGVVNVPCEVIGRAPGYGDGRMQFKLLDMRRVLATY